jgi:hypothetical protein
MSREECKAEERASIQQAEYTNIDSVTGNIYQSNKA